MTNTLVMELKSFESDFIYFQHEKDNLRKDYLNKFVAVHNGKIIASGSSIEEVKDKLEKEGINPSKTIIEFVPEEESIMIL